MHTDLLSHYIDRLEEYINIRHELPEREFARVLTSICHHISPRLLEFADEGILNRQMIMRATRANDRLKEYTSSFSVSDDGLREEEMDAILFAQNKFDTSLAYGIQTMQQRERHRER